MLKNFELLKDYIPRNNHQNVIPDYEVFDAIFELHIKKYGPTKRDKKQWLWWAKINYNRKPWKEFLVWAKTYLEGSYDKKRRCSS